MSKTHTINGDTLFATIGEICRDAWREGEKQRVSVENEQGETLIEVSLLWAVLIAISVPSLAVILGVGVLLDKVTIVVDEVE